MSRVGLSGVIEDLVLITSPIRQYVKLEMVQLMGFFGHDDRAVRYVSMGATDFALVDYSPRIEQELAERAKELGMIIRFKTEYWPRLEEDRWRKMNGISPA